ncbi:MAG: hypothetical protein LBM23_02665 [Propionibacteriaceae bacterium]|jgi:hypothetical protein|nr:hypothetical protein [Propionibacteriaceae bacterium]
MTEAELRHIIRLILEAVEEATAPRPPRALVCFTGALLGFHAALASLASLKYTTLECSAVLSPSADHVLDREAIDRLGMSDPGPHLVTGHDLLVLPTLTANTAAKAALGFGDSLATNLVMEFLLAGKPVIASRTGVCPDSPVKKAMFPDMTRGYADLLRGHLRGLSDLGVTIVDADELGHAVRAALGDRLSARADERAGRDEHNTDALRDERAGWDERATTITSSGDAVGANDRGPRGAAGSVAAPVSVAASTMPSSTPAPTPATGTNDPTTRTGTTMTSGIIWGRDRSGPIRSTAPSPVRWSIEPHDRGASPEPAAPPPIRWAEGRISDATPVRPRPALPEPDQAPAVPSNPAPAIRWAKDLLVTESPAEVPLRRPGRSWAEDGASSHTTPPLNQRDPNRLTPSTATPDAVPSAHQARLLDGAAPAPEASAPGQTPRGDVVDCPERVIAAHDLAGLAPRTVVRIARDALVTPLARDQARARRIEFERI